MKKLLFISACVLALCSCDETKQYKCQCDNGKAYFNEQSTAKDAEVWCDTHDQQCPGFQTSPTCLVQWDCNLQ